MIQMLNKEYEIRNLKAVQARIKEIEVDYTEDFIRLHREIITTYGSRKRGAITTIASTENFIRSKGMSEQWERMKELKKPNGKRLVTLQRFPERYVIAPWEEKTSELKNGKSTTRSRRMVHIQIFQSAIHSRRRKQASQKLFQFIMGNRGFIE